MTRRARSLARWREMAREPPQLVFDVCAEASSLWEDAGLTLEEITDDQFIEISRRSGDVFSERGFENAYNNDELFDFVNTYIRFIE